VGDTGGRNESKRQVECRDRELYRNGLGMAGLQLALSRAHSKGSGHT
jgi:hypothetical protein